MSATGKRKRGSAPFDDVGGLLQRATERAAEHTRRFGRCSGLLRPMREALELADEPERVSKRRYRTTSNCELGKRVERELALTIGGGVLPKGAHRMTRALHAFLAKRRWTLLATQVPLHDSAVALHTRADFLARDEESGALVLIELKTGYDAGYASPLAPPEHLGTAAPAIERLFKRRDSHAARHQLQLAWMDWQLRSAYAVPPAALFSCVLRVTNRRGADVRAPERLAPWAERASDTLVARLREHVRALRNGNLRAVAAHTHAKAH